MAVAPADPAVKPENKYERVYGVFGLRFSADPKGEDTVSNKRPKFNNYDAVVAGLGSISGWNSKRFQFLSGGSGGVELLVERWCKECEVPFERIRPDIEANTVTRAAFDARNQRIISRSTHILIFWDGHEKGFLEIISTATMFGKRVEIIPILP